MNDKQQKLLLNLLQATQGAAVQPDELTEIIKIILTVIKELKIQLENQIIDTKSESNTSVKEIAYTLNELELKVKGLINSSESTSLSKIKELSQRLTTEISRIEQTIPSMPDLSVYEAKLEEIRASIPVIKETILDNAIQIRDKLETLKDDERLDISAIKGFGKRTSKMSDEILNRAIGIVDQRTSFLIQKVSNLSDKVTRLESSPVTTGTFTPPETPDGIITAFTAIGTPKFVVTEQGVAIDGYGYTYSNNIVTMTIAPEQFIRLMY